MAGAFTHFIICDVAKREKKTIGNELMKLLNRHASFLFLGAASPDLPYLSIKTGEVNWADVMHYERTNSIAINGYEELSKRWSSKTVSDEIKLAWLFGLISHLIADATIHPIVKATVGPYERNKTKHRVCEMTQDSIIYSMKKKLDITYTEFSSRLRFCKKSEEFDSLIKFWKDQTIKSYTAKKEAPNPELWFDTYTRAIDVAEGGSDVVGFFRHLGPTKGFVYHPSAEIESEYSENLRNYFLDVKLPNNMSGDFSEFGFNKAVKNVTEAWAKLYTGLGSGTLDVSSIIKNWNLDTGEDMDSPINEVTYWV